MKKEIKFPLTRRLRIFRYGRRICPSTCESLLETVPRARVGLEVTLGID